MTEIRKKKFKGSITFKEAFVSGLIMTGVITIFAPLNQILISNFISPHYFENIINYAVSSGEMNFVDAKEYFNLKSYMIQVLIGSPILGTLTTVLVSLFIKNNK